MAAGWKFLGEFHDKDGKQFYRDCVVVIRDREAAEAEGQQILYGALSIMTTALSDGDVAALGLKPGDIRK